MTININSKDKITQYRDYVNFLHPVFKVSPQERDVLAMLIQRYNDIKTEVSNPAFVNKLLFNTDTRNEIAEKLDMSKIRYDGIIIKFRKMKLIDGKTLNDKIVPIIKDGVIAVNVVINEKSKV